MSKLLEIAQLGADVIREVAKEVEDIHSLEIQELLDDMLFTCSASKGMGIAAPQLYESKRIIVISSHPNERYPYAPMMEPTLLINPKIISFSSETHIDWEGCLSLPGLRALVPRYTEVEVSYLDRDGNIHKSIYKDFLARVFQHEYDHLEGKVFIDRVDSTMDVVMEREFQRIISGKKLS